MTIHFELPPTLHTKGVALSFQDIEIVGPKEKKARVQVSDGHGAIDFYDFASWKEMKAEYPTLQDFLRILGNNENWAPHIGENRILFIQSLQGHEGIYEIKEPLWVNVSQENHNEIMEPLKVKKLKK